MKPQSIFGIVLILLGIVVLAYPGFTTTKRERVLDLGPLKVDADVQQTHYIHPILPWAMIIGGGGLVALGMGRKK